MCGYLQTINNLNPIFMKQIFKLRETKKNVQLQYLYEKI